MEERNAKKYEREVMKWISNITKTKWSQASDLTYDVFTTKHITCDRF